MYKTKNILKFAVSMLFVVASFTACVKDDGFDTPQIQYEDNDISNTTIATIKNNIINNYVAGDESSLIYTFPEDSPLIVSGYVVSNDFNGNFYKKLIIQDAPENPNGGLEIDIDLRSLYTKYNFGRKIYLKLAGLSIQYVDGQQGGAPNYPNQSDPTDNTPGVYKIGIRDADYKLMRISATDLDKYIVRSGVSATIQPKVINASEFSDDTMNTFVSMDNVQFKLNELGKSYAGEVNDAYDAERVLLECDTQIEFGLSTSTFAPFKDEILPEGKGTIKAVLKKSFREATSVLVLNSLEDIDLNDLDNRCDPILLECSGSTTTGSNVIFSEDFESISDEADLIPLGWTNVNVNGGSHIWKHRSYNGNKYMQNGAYNTGENPLEAWLVTPAINLDSTTDEVFTFDVNVGYYNGDALSVYASTDFTGDVTTATWQLINDVDLPTSPSNTYGSFHTAGSISVDCLDGDVYFAFKYKGGDGDVTSTFQVDNIKVSGN